MAKINLQGQEKQTTQLIQTFTISICIATIAFFNLNLSLAKLNSESQAKIYEIQRKANVAENRLEWTKEAAKLQAQNEITQAKIYEIERKANVAESRLEWTKEAAKLQTQKRDHAFHPGNRQEERLHTERVPEGGQRPAQRDQGPGDVCGAMRRKETEGGRTEVRLGAVMVC